MNTTLALLVGAGGAAALFTSFGSYIKSWFSRLFSHVIVTNKCTQKAAYAILAYLNKHYKRSKFSVNFFDSYHTFVKPLSKLSRVFFKTFTSGSYVYWIGRTPVWVSSKGVAGVGPGSSVNDLDTTFSYIRGSINWLKLLTDVAEWELDNCTNQQVDRYRIVRFMDSDSGRPGKANKEGNDLDGLIESNYQAFRAMEPVGWKLDQIGEQRKAGSINKLSLNPNLQKLEQEIDFWFKNEKWYRSKNIAWKRGYLFYGEPGTGKTSFVRAIAEKLDLPVYIFDLATTSNYDFCSDWRKMLSDQPCICLLEDVDTVFTLRKNVKEGVSQYDDFLTFDCLLGQLDGIAQTNGLLVFITTNDMSKIDPALGSLTGGDIASRPGRIDRIVEFTTLDEPGRVKLASRILDSQEDIDLVVAKGKADTAAQLQERAVALALDNKFKEINETATPSKFKTEELAEFTDRLNKFNAYMENILDNKEPHNIFSDD